MSDGAGEFAIGNVAPGFELPDTDGETHSLGEPDGSSATVVLWTCNHCPYALAWHDRMLDVARDYGDRDVRFFAVNSNNAVTHPADSYEAMQERLRDEEWPLPYLHDESQEVARAWGALKTPDVFILDGSHVLRYRGAPDPDYGDPAHRASWVRDALDDVLAGEDVRLAETEPVGCGVKWRK